MSKVSDHPLPYVAVLSLLVAAIVLQTRSEDGKKAPPGAVEQLLQQELNARVGAVLQWERRGRLQVEHLADDLALRSQGWRSVQAHRAQLGDWLANVCHATFDGCVVAAPGGMVLAAYGPSDLPLGVVRRAEAGRTVQSRSRAIEGRPSPGGSGFPGEAVFFASPVVRDGRIWAVVGGRVDLDEELDPILGARPIGRTGETYAVDASGFMLTRSRFAEHASHRTDAAHVLGAPTAVLLTPTNEWTRAMAHLEHDGMDVGGYVDYRGIRVVGAWRWLDELGAGVVTEMDASEAFVRAAH